MAHATISPKEASRRFILAFSISAAAMIVAALVYVLFGKRFMFDWQTQALLTTLVLFASVIGVWLVQKGEKHTGYGVLFGSLFGIVLGAIAVVLLALILTAFPQVNLRS
ncbi:MAG: hypothetical protein U0517_03475 [Candidatus Andersenbacteria bacterium]